MTVFNLLARWRQIDAFANHLAGLADIGPVIGPIGLITLALSCQGRIQDLKLGGGREMWSVVSSAEGTRMEAPKACSPSKWYILMHSGARLGQL